MDKDKFEPLVSIIIPVYNGSDYMREAIDSALAQTYKNIEIIVINDGSKDSTEEIALSYGEKIRYFAKENGGVATALNMGIENMRGDYFSWLSHDDIYLPEKVEKQIACLSFLDDKTTLITCPIILINKEGSEIDRYEPFLIYPEEQLSKPLFALLRGQIDGCCLLIHKSHFDYAGVFRTDFPTTQDYELWFRMMRRRELSLTFGKQPLVKRRIHENQGSKVDSHLAECDELWTMMIDSLTEDEMITLSGSVLEFYSDMNKYLELMPYKGVSYYINTLYQKARLEPASLTIAYYREYSFLIHEISAKNKAYSKNAFSKILRKCQIFIFEASYAIILKLRIKEQVKRSRLFKFFRNKGII